MVSYKFKSDDASSDRQNIEHIFRASHVNLGLTPESNMNQQFKFNQYKVQIVIAKPHIAHRQSFKKENYITEISTAIAKEIAIFGSRANADTPQFTIDCLKNQVVKRITMMASFIKKVEEVRLFRAFFVGPILQQVNS